MIVDLGEVSGHERLLEIARSLPWGKPKMDMPCCQNVTDLVEAECEGDRHVVKRMFVKLIPGQHRDMHVDWEKWRCPDRYRIHVPVLTNPDVEFIIDGEPVHMEVGRHYLIDPSEPHAVFNRGDTDRIHYFFDFQ